ncbi:MAG: hypothetical protein VXW87_00470 [Pseudomonadota bacterium]|nr:hypothetical protein [Pseudomonadota bacterium]
MLSLSGASLSIFSIFIRHPLTLIARLLGNVVGFFSSFHIIEKIILSGIALYAAIGSIYQMRTKKASNIKTKASALRFSPQSAVSTGLTLLGLFMIRKVLFSDIFKLSMSSLISSRSVIMIPIALVPISVSWAYLCIKKKWFSYMMTVPSILLFAVTTSYNLTFGMILQVIFILPSITSAFHIVNHKKTKKNQKNSLLLSLYFAAIYIIFMIVFAVKYFGLNLFSPFAISLGVSTLTILSFYDKSFSATITLQVMIFIAAGYAYALPISAFFPSILLILSTAQVSHFKKNILDNSALLTISSGFSMLVALITQLIPSTLLLGNIVRSISFGVAALIMLIFFPIEKSAPISAKISYYGLATSFVLFCLQTISVMIPTLNSFTQIAKHSATISAAISATCGAGLNITYLNTSNQPQPKTNQPPKQAV